jgi:precorrin-4 methylase
MNLGNTLTIKGRKVGPDAQIIPHASSVIDQDAVEALSYVTSSLAAADLNVEMRTMEMAQVLERNQETS